MKYHLKIKEKVIDVNVDSTSHENTYKVTFKDHITKFSYHSVSSNWYSLDMEGKKCQVFVANNDQGKHVFVQGRYFLIQDADLLGKRKRRSSGSPETPHEVTPPMPSVVVRILVNEGDKVKKGQGLIVVSAMKMETTLVAPYAGVVKKINATLDAKVAPGDILVEIEQD